MVIFHSYVSLPEGNNGYCNNGLVGGLKTILKNDGVRQIGMIIPNFFEMEK